MTSEHDSWNVTVDLGTGEGPTEVTVLTFCIDGPKYLLLHQVCHVFDAFRSHTCFG